MDSTQIDARKRQREIGLRVKQAREAHKLTQGALGAKIGISQQSVQELESGRSKSTRVLHRYAAALAQSIDWLETGKGEMRQPAANDDRPLGQALTMNDLSPADLPTHLAAAGAWPKDIPVLGATVGGSDGDFTLNVGQIVDYARRPPSLAKPRTVFALYVQGSSMAPWRPPGSLVYLDPIRPARAGEHVVVECHPDREGEGHPAYLKELVARAGAKVKLRQYTPDRGFDIPTSKVKQIYRVIEWEEVLGI